MRDISQQAKSPHLLASCCMYITQSHARVEFILESCSYVASNIKFRPTEHKHTNTNVNTNTNTNTNTQMKGCEKEVYDGATEGELAAEPSCCYWPDCIVYVLYFYVLYWYTIQMVWMCMYRYNTDYTTVHVFMIYMLTQIWHQSCYLSWPVNEYSVYLYTINSCMCKM